MIRRLDSMPAAVVAAGFGVSLRTVRKWKSRYRQGGVEALVDRSSRPLRCRSKLTEEDYGEIFSLRQKRLTGDAIAARLGRSRSSVFRALRTACLFGGKAPGAALPVGKAGTNAASGYQASGKD